MNTQTIDTSEIADLPAVSKKLSEYSESERQSFPALLEESEKVRIYDQDDIEEEYLWAKTKTEQMGPVGSRQEREFNKRQNFAEFHERPGKRLTQSWLSEKQQQKFR